MTQVETGSTTGRRSRVGLWIAIVMGIGVGVAQALAASTSYQMANLVSYGCGFVGLISGAVWWARFHRGSRALRLAPLLGLVIAPVVFLYFYEVHGVTGEFLPEVRRRGEVRGPLPEAEQTADAARWALRLGSQSHPGFMGAGRDGVLAARAFSIRWEDSPPEVLWKQAIGEGLAGMAVGRAEKVQAAAGTDPVGSANGSDEGVADEGGRWLGYTIEQRGKQEWVVCYDLSDGSVLWQHQEDGYHSNPMGDVGPRSTPTLEAADADLDSAGKVYAQGATGTVWCLDAIQGDLLWRVSLLELAGITQKQSEEYVPWGRSGSPLRVDDLLVVPMGGAPGGPEGVHSLVALDAETGAVKWMSGTHQVSYASPVLATIDGVRQIVSVNEDTVTGTDVSTGELLWTADWPGKTNQGASCSNPIAFSDGRVLVSKEYGGGAKMLQVTRGEEGWSTEVLWEDHRVLKTKFTNAVIHGDFAYAISNGTLECVDLRDGRRQWRQGRGERVGHGHLVLVEDVLVSSTEQGGLVLVELTPEAYRELGRVSVIEGKTWNPPTIFDRYALLRNGREMALVEFQPAAIKSSDQASSGQAVHVLPVAHRSGD